MLLSVLIDKFWLVYLSAVYFPPFPACGKLYNYFSGPWVGGQEAQVSGCEIKSSEEFFGLGIWGVFGQCNKIWRSVYFILEAGPAGLSLCILPVTTLRIEIEF